MGRPRPGSRASSSMAGSSSVRTSRTNRTNRSSSRSRASSVGGASSLGFGGMSLQGGASDLSEYSIPTTLPQDADEASRSFARMLDDLRSASSDPRRARKAACCAALVETATERRPTRSSDGDGADDEAAAATPNEVLVAAIAALSSLQSSLESRQKSGEPGDVESLLRDLDDAALPLLEILRRVLPHAAHPSNNRGALLAHQFGGLSRMMRLFVALARALPSSGDDSASSRNKGGKGRRGPQGGGGGGGSAGGNALLRQILRVSTTLLLVAPPDAGVSEKELARLLHGAIVPAFHDARPKVRRAAWGSGMEIIVVSASTFSSSSSSGGDDDDGMDDGSREIAARYRRQRRSVADMLWEYCDAIIANYSPGNAETSSKLAHVLRFLTTSLPHADDARIRVRFGEGCLKLMGADGGDDKGGEASAEVVKETLLALLSCLETTERESEEPGGEAGEEGMQKFAAGALAFLLRRRPSASNSSFGGDVNVAYGRCLLACMERMLGRRASGDADDGAPPAASELLAAKLLPNALASMLHLCADGEGGDDDRGEGCGPEFNRFVSRAIPAMVSHLRDDGKKKDARLRRMALEALPQCVPILVEAMQIKYRGAWGSILPGGYATFVASLADCLPGRKLGGGGGNGEDNPLPDGDTSELEGKLRAWIKTLVSSLLRLRGDIEKDGTARTAVEYAASTVIRGTGVELFLSVVDFVDDDADDDGKKKKKEMSTTGGGIRDDRAWLLPLMKQSAIATSIPSAGGGGIVADASRARLSFFQGRVLGLARRCDAASADGHRTAAEASIQRARVVELWSLFPAFCAFPLDVRENLGTVAKTVVRALGDHGRYPKLIPIVCGGLKNLAIGIKERAESQSTPKAKEDCEVLSNVSTKILPSLFKLVESLNAQPTSSSSKKSEEDMEVEDAPSSKELQARNQQNTQLVEAVTDAIGQLAQMCPPDFLQNLFKKVVQRLLVATTEAAEDGSDDRDAKNATALRTCSLLGLGQALVASGSLDDASLSLLYRAVRPLVRTDEHDPRVQKRAYKVLAEICERHKEFVTSGERLGEMVDLMVDSIVTCQVSARHMRLRCMTCVVEGFDSENNEHMVVIPKIMGEVLLCLKDSNARTREAAYQLLLAMATARDDVEDYFRIVLAALGAQTTHMRSAAVMALSRLIYEYAREDPAVQELLPSLMNTVAVLFDDPSREVTKSVISFVRVSVAAMAPDQLEPLLPTVVGGIMKYDKGRDRFRAKIKIILKKLVRVFGYHTIAPLVPEKDARLITHMRKLSERAARRKVAGVQDGRSEAQNNFDDMMESDEDDSDDGRTFMTGATGFTKMTTSSGKTAKRLAMDRSVRNKSVISEAMSAATSKSMKSSGPRIRDESNGEVLDMLDASKMARSVHFADMDVNDRDFSDDDDDAGMDDIQFDNHGKIVIGDGMPKLEGGKTEEHYDSDDEENLELKAGGGGKRRRTSKFESVKLAKAEKNAAKGKQQKLKKDSTVSLGAAYKSRKAGGDVKRKGQKFEPYAFVPLDARDYSKKNRGGAVSKMGTVVRSSKRRRG